MNSLLPPTYIILDIKRLTGLQNYRIISYTFVPFGLLHWYELLIQSSDLTQKK